MPLSPDVTLSGRIDRVDEHHDGSLEIVDYKSGRETVSEEDVAKSLAMSVYQLLLKHLHPDRRVFATLVALRTGARASWELLEDARTELAAECLKIGETLRTKDWEQVLPSPTTTAPIATSCRTAPASGNSTRKTRFCRRSDNTESNPAHSGGAMLVHQQAVGLINLEIRPVTFPRHIFFVRPL